MNDGIGTWRQSQIKTIKQAKKVELDEVELRSGRAARLEHILNRLGALADAKDANGLLERFIYVISALVHHGRSGGLKPPQINKIARLGQSLLHIQKIDLRRSTLAVLYGELSLALSQVYRREGDQWLAAWNQQSAQHFLRAKGDPLLGVTLVAMGNRALRLGNAPMASAFFTASETNTLPAAQRELARLGRIKAWRLGGRRVEAAALAQATHSDLALSEAAALELSWEVACCNIDGSANIGPLIQMTQRGKSHHIEAYVLEASLWARTTQSRQWLTRAASTRALARTQEGGRRRQKHFLRCLAEIEALYDHRTPIEMRVQRVGAALGSLNSLVSVDMELLVWAAAARGLARLSAFSLAALALAEYQALSLRLSAGAQCDALGTIGDMLDRPWHAGHFRDSA